MVWWRRAVCPSLQLLPKHAKAQCGPHFAARSTNTAALRTSRLLRKHLKRPRPTHGNATSPCVPFTPAPTALSGIEQSLLASRIGPAALFNPKRPSGHYLLDTAHPGHMEIARKLVAAAVASGELPNLWNLRLRGEWLVGC
jgi:hypothetical protein